MGHSEESNSEVGGKYFHSKPRVANRLRELRHEYGLTQEKLAEDLAVTRHTILALEVGRYVPSIELALRLAAYFDRPLESIFWLVHEEGSAPVKAVRLDDKA